MYLVSHLPLLPDIIMLNYRLGYMVDVSSAARIHDININRSLTYIVCVINLFLYCYVLTKLLRGSLYVCDFKNTK